MTGVPEGGQGGKSGARYTTNKEQRGYAARVTPLNFLAPRPGLEPGTYGLTGRLTEAGQRANSKTGNDFSGWPLAGLADRPNSDPQCSVLRTPALKGERNQRVAGVAWNTDRAQCGGVARGPWQLSEDALYAPGRLMRPSAIGHKRPLPSDCFDREVRNRSDI